MPGGRRNPFSVTTIVDAVQHAKSNARDVAQVAKSLAQAKLGEIPFIDIEIQFIGASDLPRMDVVGSADPYFVANIDGNISFVSAVKADTLAPVWNELWRVKNVPAVAELRVQLLDKDDGAPHDDYIGKFKTSIAKGAKEVEIKGPLSRKSQGSFWLKIESHRSKDDDPSRFPYLFDGPIRYSRSYSPTVGRLTNLNDARLYATWKMYVKGVPMFFGDNCQGWNRSYKAAQSIFQGPARIAVRSGIQAGHRMLYAHKTSNQFGVIEEPADVMQLMHGGTSRPSAPHNPQFKHRIKPAVYTYIISAEDDSFRFSETGAAFPKGGWENFSDDTQDNEVDWELVFDNNSGTYAPDNMLLPKLRELLEYNFPGFEIHAWDHGDPKLEASREACRDYAIKYRGVGQDELQPHTKSGEETLSCRVCRCAERQLGK